MRNNDLQNTIQKTKDVATQTPPLLRVSAGFLKGKVVPVQLAEIGYIDLLLCHEVEVIQNKAHP